MWHFLSSIKVDRHPKSLRRRRNAQDSSTTPQLPHPTVELRSSTTQHRTSRFSRWTLFTVLFVGGCHKTVRERTGTDACICTSSGVCDATVPNPSAPVVMAMTCPLDGRSIRTSIRADGVLWHREVQQNGSWTGVPFVGRSTEDVRRFMRRIIATGIFDISPGSYQSPPQLTTCTLSLRNVPPREGYVEYVWGGAPTIPEPVLQAHRLFTEFVHE